jgi:hypothetical protein
VQINGMYIENNRQQQWGNHNRKNKTITQPWWNKQKKKMGKKVEINFSWWWCVNQGEKGSYGYIIFKTSN